MENDDVPVGPHDDGIYQYQKKLEHAALSMEQLAGEVIVAFRNRDRERVLAIKKPVTRNDNLTEKETIRLMHEQAGKRPITAASLFCFSTRREHENARNMGAFLMHMEPDYVSLAVAARDHERYCWRVAVLNAYRILDLLGIEGTKFPFAWIPVEASDQDRNFNALVSSAAYLMGYYYAKAQAMQRVRDAHRGDQMTGKGGRKLGELGSLVQKACLHLYELEEDLWQKKISLRVMQVLEEMGHASIGAAYEINGKAISPKNLSNCIDRTRKRLGKKIPHLQKRG